MGTPGSSCINQTFSEYIRPSFITASYLLHQNKLPSLPFLNVMRPGGAQRPRSYCKRCWINSVIEHINLLPVQMPISPPAPQRLLMSIKCRRRKKKSPIQLADNILYPRPLFHHRLLSVIYSSPLLFLQTSTLFIPARKTIRGRNVSSWSERDRQVSKRTAF